MSSAITLLGTVCFGGSCYVFAQPQLYGILLQNEPVVWFMGLSINEV
jgi:hypothetical protein